MTDADHLGVSRVLDEEYAHLHPDWTRPPGEADATTQNARLLDTGHVALCLSGGGIRSASFALGILQRFADTRVLDRVDYLSTVSGGGYIGGWLAAWMAHATAAGEPDRVLEALRGEHKTPAQPEPEPIEQVRRYSRYLSPQVGALSADLWTLLATVARNLLLNWLILLPLLSALMLLPRIYIQLLRFGPLANAAWWNVTGGAGVLLLITAIVYVVLDLPSLGDAKRSQTGFLTWCLAPLCAGQFLVSLGWAWQAHHGLLPSFWRIVLLAAFGAGAPWLIAALAGKGRRLPIWAWIAAVTTGALTIAGVLLARGSLAPAMIASPALGPQLYASFDVPLALAIISLGGVVMAGLAGRIMTDDDREWWARAGGWLLIVAIAWATVTSLVLFSLPAIDSLHFQWPSVDLSQGWGQVGLSVVTLLLGGAATDVGRSVRDTPPAERSPWLRATFALAVPAFALALLVALAASNEDLLAGVATLHWFGRFGELSQLAEILALEAGLVAVGFAADYLISVNRFSLHGMYRERLIRTFLGASRSSARRTPNRFTGFDRDDNMPLADLQAIRRPILLLNATLNQTDSENFGWQERRAQSFSFTPLHSGSAVEAIGYRRSAGYAGGVTLGSAVAISGAAVSSSMGELSTPTLTFLLTMFNARLGVWLGNPNNDRTWRDAEPTFGSWSLFNELLGRVTATRPHVYLSDGEHFENLGLYEMVRRRCRYIFVSDAGCDPGYDYEDLANAVRKVRLDFGVPIEFPHGVGATTPAAEMASAHFAIGRIRYSAVDAVGPEKDGVIVYIKATPVGDEPVDVANYRRAHPDFPHQSTVEQWFGEAEFEAYRALGWQSAASLPDIKDSGSRFAL